MADKVATKLLDVLAAERAAIRKAAFDALPELSDAKSELFNQLTQSRSANEDLGRIQQELAQNQALLSAAIAGVNTARGRLAALQNVREGLSVYDQSGQMAKVPMRPPGMEKKA